MSFMYILDEFSVGLYFWDSGWFICVLCFLCDFGNMVIVVEYEEDIIESVDYFIDIGLVVGIYGGEVVFVGFYEGIYFEVMESLIIKYMSGCMSILVFVYCCKLVNYIEV